MDSINLLQPNVLARILAYCEPNESSTHSSAGALRCTSTEMNARLSSGEYYYAANHELTGLCRCQGAATPRRRSIHVFAYDRRHKGMWLPW
mmetsp:Transcript_17209/g.34499  ORF Transcript_17209/g.34499 Transcript_17209/m.34499 type:complete len:91 (+) Transcript_17209:2252-2524(+)